MGYEQIDFQPMVSIQGPQTVYSEMVDSPTSTSVAVMVAVNAVLGGGSVQVSLETSLDGRVWNSLATTPAIGAPMNAPLSASIYGGAILLRYYRTRADLAGAGVGATYSITGILRD